jgi:Spy/CpxP family protein refolding chaperone
MNRLHPPQRTLLASAIGIAALAATVALAQPPAPGPAAGTGPVPPTATTPDWAQARIDRMGWRLNLTPEQKTKLKPIFEQRQALRNAQRQAMRKQVAQILTPAQLAQWDQMRAQRGLRRGAGPCRGGRGFGPGQGYGLGHGYGPGRGYGPGMGYGPGAGLGPGN